MTFLKPRDAVLHCWFRPGAEDARAVVFANSLGTDFRIWDEVIAALPKDLSILTYDKRGHGLSGGQAEDIDTHVQDCADLMDAFGIAHATVCGVSVGGMIAQGLAAKRPDLVAGLLLSNTAPRIGEADTWNERIAGIRDNGLEPVADAILERWFSARFRRERPVDLHGYRMMLARTPVEGYLATCAAVRDADLTDSTGRLSVPTICLAGSDDLATPPGLVEDMAERIEGAEYRCLDGVGHLPSIEAPDRVSSLLLEILERAT